MYLYSKTSFYLFYVICFRQLQNPIDSPSRNINLMILFVIDDDDDDDD